MKKQKYNVAIVGATGVVGMEFLRVLEKRNFPVANLKLLASRRSVGKTRRFQDQEITVQELTADSFHGVDIAFFSAGSDRSKEFAPKAVAAGALVVDNSSAFRQDPKVPLVIPEINPETIKNHHGIIANPNCTTIIMCLAIHPIHQLNPIRHIVVASYQAVSGAGLAALAELKNQQKAILNGQTPQAKVFKHVIADNIFSHDSTILESGYNQEEEKMIFETRKILGMENLAISPTCVRVPIARAHSEAIHLELTHDVNLLEIRQALQKAPGIRVVDDRRQNLFPMPINTSGQDLVLVGRMRTDFNDPKHCQLFVCGDQLLKGAALNAVQIAETALFADPCE